MELKRPRRVCFSNAIATYRKSSELDVMNDVLRIVPDVRVVLHHPCHLLLRWEEHLPMSTSHPISKHKQHLGETPIQCRLSLLQVLSCLRSGPLLGWKSLSIDHAIQNLSPELQTFGAGDTVREGCGRGPIACFCLNAMSTSTEAFD